LIVGFILTIVIVAAQFFFPFVLLAAVLLILFSLCGYISVFWTYPTLQKYMFKSDYEVKSTHEEE